jgi:hypothetical protein
MRQTTVKEFLNAKKSALPPGNVGPVVNILDLPLPGQYIELPVQYVFFRSWFNKGSYTQ